MAIQQATVSCTSTGGGTLIATASAGHRVYVKVLNRSTGTVYLGGTTAATSSGYPLTTADVAFEATLVHDESLYGTSTGAASVHVLRFGDTT